MIIRTAKIKDKEKMSRLIAQFRIDLEQYKAISSIPKIDEAESEFQEYVDVGYPIFVAENSNGDLLGYLVCRLDEGVVWAESLVSTDVRRSGIATKLYIEAEKVSEKLGNDTVFNWVHSNNDKIIKFLSKMGYDVLNLIEIRKPWKNEVLASKINVGNHEYNY